MRFVFVCLAFFVVIAAGVFFGMAFVVAIQYNLSWSNSQEVIEHVFMNASFPKLLFSFSLVGLLAYGSTWFTLRGL